MRKTAAAIFLGLLVICGSGCTTDPVPVSEPQHSAPSVETSIGAGIVVGDPTHPLQDEAGHTPGEVLLEYLAAHDTLDAESLYALLATPKPDWESIASEAGLEETVYAGSLVHETRVYEPGSALVRVTYSAQTTSSDGTSREFVVEEPGEWWRVEKVDGLWRVGYLARQ